jgi:arginyl-tRNA synthetase
LILRSDGTSLYSTKDLALAKRKFEDYGVDYSIYVVDVRQTFYFKQVFKVLELWGFEQAKDCYHLAYEIVTDPAGTMSSRAGNVVPFEDFAQMAVSRALAIVESKRPDLGYAQKREIARAVALGAMKYPMLSVDDNKVIVFDLDEALSFEGRSAPYIQYAHARACRILEKAGPILNVEPDYSYLGVPTISRPKPELLAEINLIEKIADFPDAVLEASERYKTHIVATYAFELASFFADFYQKCDVLRGGTPDGMRAARLQLVRAFRQTIANGLALLGIEAPEVM